MRKIRGRDSARKPWRDSRLARLVAAPPLGPSTRPEKADTSASAIATWSARKWPRRRRGCGSPPQPTAHGHSRSTPLVLQPLVGRQGQEVDELVAQGHLVEQLARLVGPALRV